MGYNYKKNKIILLGVAGVQHRVNSVCLNTGNTGNTVYRGNPSVCTRYVSLLSYFTDLKQPKHFFPTVRPSSAQPFDRSIRSRSK